MAKALVFIVGGISAIVGFVAATALIPSSYDYAEASEERQQKSLDNIAKGFEIGFKATAGGGAVINRISTSAATDTVAVDIQFKRPEIEMAGAMAIEDFRKMVYKYNCGFLAKKSVLAAGVTLKLRMTKPSGSLLTTFTINEEGCRPYLDA